MQDLAVWAVLAALILAGFLILRRQTSTPSATAIMAVVFAVPFTVFDARPSMFQFALYLMLFTALLGVWFRFHRSW